MKKVLLPLLIVLLAGFIVACDEGADNSDVDGIEVVHELGTTIVPENPETIVVFDFGVIDILDHLGVEIAALPKANVPSYLSQFEGDQYENAGTLFEPDFEMLANLDPDLIIISGRTQESYKDLSDLAPTLFMEIDTDDYLGSFEHNVTLLGKIFDQEDEAIAAVDQIKIAVDDLVEIVPADKVSLIILTNDGAVSAYGPGSRFGIIHDDFGIPPVTNEIDVTTHGQNISFEYIANANPDYLFVLDRNAATGGDGEASSTIDNDLVNGTTAAKEGNIIYLTPDYWYLSSGGIESVTQMVKEIHAGIE